MEVDIYPYTKDQQEMNRRGKRARKQKESAPKQRNLNDKNARRYLTQLANTNFTQDDLHITATSSGNFAFTIEHSTNGSAWATLGTFTTTGGSVTSEYKSGAGTVNQYLRFVATRTAGTVSVACAIARK